MPMGCNEDESDATDRDAGQTPDAGGGADAGDGSDASDDAAAASASPGCSRGTASAGDHDESLDFGGKTRAYRLHVPSGYSGESTPLVINMHGFLSNQMEQVKLTGMSALADREGFIVVYPAGAGEPLAWNAGDCCEYTERDRDDIGFIAALLDEIGETACIDLTRVYATGFSNGGFLSHRIGCELSDRFAAIATVSAVLGVAPESCKPGRSLPVLQIHGEADPTIPYAGGAPMGWELLYPGLPAPNYRSVTATSDFWREQSGCAATRSESNEGDAKCESYDDCDDGSAVTLCTVSGGGHTWPGGDTSAFEAVVAGIPVTTLVGPTSTSFDASAYIWDFFEQHPMP
jgi:polyhydroxybutyrate depolymerase